LHLITPTTSSNVQFCKGFLSATLLGYPSPVIVNWGMDTKSKKFLEVHNAKISGVLEYLNRFPAERDDDIALIVDGFDVWFQLPADVLLQRYHAANAAANRRIKKQVGGDYIMQRQGIYQSVIFGAEKNCYPNENNEMACYAVPQSTLPEDIYGPNTDATKETNRPRWLNSGTVIGPIGDLKRIYQRAYDLYLQHSSSWSGDQRYFSNIFGAQEFMRHSIINHGTYQSKGSNSKYLQIDNFKSMEQPSFGSNRPDSDDVQAAEYHIGVDYHSQLFQTMGYSYKEVEWIKHNGEQDIILAQELLGISNPRTVIFPHDLYSSPPPYSAALNHTRCSQSLVTVPDTNCVSQASLSKEWRDIPLHTNLKSGTIPVTLHFNGQKWPVKDWWPKMWFVHSARQLLYWTLALPKGPVYTERDGKNTPGLDSMGFDDPGEPKKEWFDFWRGERGTAYTTKGRKKNWQEMCAAFESEILDDYVPSKSDM
jgi:hypothetical protein